MSGLAAGKKRPRATSSGPGKPRATNEKKAAPKNAVAVKNKGRQHRGAGALSEDIELAGGNDFSDEDFMENRRHHEDEDDAALLPAPTLEETETADERRLRLAKELISKYDAQTGRREGRGDGEVGSDEDDEEDDALVTAADDVLEQQEAAKRRKMLKSLSAASATAGAGAGSVFDAITARLKEDALASSGAIYRPLAAAVMLLTTEAATQGATTMLAGNVPLYPKSHCMFRRAHQASVTCVAASDDGSRVYAGSKDCRISAWDTLALSSTTADVTPAAPALASASLAPISSASSSFASSSSSSSSRPPAKRPRKTNEDSGDDDDDDNAGQGHRKRSSDGAPSSSASSSFPPITRVFYPGRQRTRADAEAQEAMSEKAQEGLFEPPLPSSSSSTAAASGKGSKGNDKKNKQNAKSGASGSSSSPAVVVLGDKGAWTGLRSVIGLGYGGGRIGSTHEVATALRPATTASATGKGSIAAAAAAAAIKSAETGEDDEEEGTERGVGIAAALNSAASAAAANMTASSGADGAGGSRPSSLSSSSSSNTNGGSLLARSSALIMTGPRIIHGQDGVSSIVIPNSGNGRSGKDKGGEDAGSSSASTAEKNAAANRAAVLRLRTVPDYRIVGHYEPVYCLALSSDGKYLASGGKDRMVRVWDPNAATAGAGAIAGGSGSGSGLGVGLNVDNFVGHKDSVTALCFRKGTHTLYSGSSDRCIKVWSLDEMSYNDTLFGHQSEVTSLHALYKDGRCLSSGGRDRTVRLWKVNEQTHLIFRGHTTDVTTDCVVFLNDSWFVSGGSDGSLSLWHSGKKKPVYTRYRAHAAPSIDDASTAVVAPNPVAPVPFSSWITAVAHCPSTDVIASGSGDGYVRLWRLVTEQEVQASLEEDDDEDEEEEEGEDYGDGREDAAAVAEKKRLAELRKRARRLQRAVNLSGLEANKGTAFKGIVALTAIPVRGIVNGLSFSADGRILTCAVGQEHKFGGWFKDKRARNGILFVRLPEWRKEEAAATGRGNKGSAGSAAGKKGKAGAK